MAQGFVAAAEIGVAGDEARLLHEPGLALVGALEAERNLVEQVKGDGRCAGFARFRGRTLRQALVDEEGAVFGGEDVEALEGVGRRALQQHEAIGLEREAGHTLRPWRRVF